MLFSLGHYNVLERIGAGGMGEIYRARDTKLGRTVAIKLLPPEIAADAARRERFLREARASAALSHPNVAMLFEVGEEAERLYLVFEYIAGRTLGATIGGRPLGVRLALDLAIQIADGLADAHAAGIVHRDIKPENIIVTPKEKAKVLDFGLAHWTEGGAAREAAPTMPEAAAGSIMGTLAYMSPEQARGEPVDARTDIFSLGIALYEMLTGRNPFAARVPTAAVLNIAQLEPAPPSAVNPDVPRDLDPIVMKALAKTPADRYQTAATLAAELRSVAIVLDIRSGEAEPFAFASRAGRRRVSWGTIATILALLLIGAAGWRWGVDDARRLWRRYVAAPPAPRIAILPLEERDAGDRTYFADGLTDDVITRLGQVPGLEVLGRSVTRELRGKPVAEVAARLGAAAVLTGTVARASGELKVRLQLVDPDAGVVVWAEEYTRPVGRVFAVQAEIADAVARALKLTLAGALRERAASRSVDARAYDLYLQARQATARRDLGQAIDLFERAIAIDDGLAEAHAGLAEALSIRASFEGGRMDDVTRARIGAAAEAALTIDPDLPAASAAAGIAASGFEEALRHLRRAIERDESYAEAYHQVGDQIIGFDPTLAVRFFERSQQLDPGIVANYIDLTIANLLLGNVDEAKRHADRLAGIVPGGLAEGVRSLVEWHTGRVASAADRMKALGGPAVPAGPRLNYARALIAAGRRAEALTFVAQQASQTNPSCDVRALYGGLLADAGRRTEANRVLRGAPANDLRCAALIAAAQGNAEAAGSALRKLAASERSLREWTQVVAGATEHMAFRRRWYPWSKVADRPPVAEAERAIETARIELRNIARNVLAGLPR